VAHVRGGSGAGVGQKPDDWNAVSLCQHHHAEQHSVGEFTFWKSYFPDGLHPRALIDAFIKASPKRREIEQVQREREASLISPRDVA
jgi:hypothetical protein